MDSNSTMNRPAAIESESDLDELLSRPAPALIESVSQIESPLLILGAGGKMGPSLAAMAARAASEARHPLEVIAVSRFSDPDLPAWLEARGVRAIACDLLEPDQLKDLPECQNLVHMAGQKFGTSVNPGLTWAVNVLAPAHVLRRFPEARIVALSTGNVYPLMPVSGPGANEECRLDPQGEYPYAAVGRERVFEHFASDREAGMTLARLNYAVETRYGVLVDLATLIWEERTVDLTMGWFNCIWQGDANNYLLRMLSAVRGFRRLNLTSPVAYSVRETAQHFGRLMGKTPKFAGEEADTALLSDAGRLCAEFGPPEMPIEEVTRWTAEWIMSGRRTLHRPTGFNVRDGRF